MSCVGQFQDFGKTLAEVIDRKPDVVLVDINIPNLGGVEFIRKLKSSMPETQFIILTTYEDSNRIFDALLAGATGYALKRTPRATLVSTLRDLHAGGSPMTLENSSLECRAYLGVWSNCMTLRDRRLKKLQVFRIDRHRLVAADAVDVVVRWLGAQRRGFEKAVLISRKRAGSLANPKCSLRVIELGVMRLSAISGVLAVSKTWMRLSSNRARPLKVPNQRYPSRICTAELTRFWGNPSSGCQTRVR